MSRYQELTDFLSEVDQDKITMTFESINDMLAYQLPDSAFRHRPWWSNRTEGKGSQNLAWQSVGWETCDVNMDLDEVTFVRVKDRIRSPARNDAVHPLSIEQAKAGLAATFNVPETAIEIHIRG